MLSRLKGYKAGRSAQEIHGILSYRVNYSIEIGGIVIYPQMDCIIEIDLPCGRKFSQEFIFADWLFFVFCGN